MAHTWGSPLSTYPLPKKFSYVNCSFSSDEPMTTAAPVQGDKDPSKKSQDTNNSMGRLY